MRGETRDHVTTTSFIVLFERNQWSLQSGAVARSICYGANVPICYGAMFLYVTGALFRAGADVVEGVGVRGWKYENLEMVAVVRQVTQNSKP